MRRILLAAAALAMADMLFLWAYERFELAALGYAVKGVDVSHHQGEIDWRTLRAGGVGFAYIKATEGAGFRDPRFAANWRLSREAGVPRGAYHFFTLCRTGAEQAANFIAATPVETDSLPHAVDAEHMGSCVDGKLLADPAAAITVFLDLVEKRFGRRPVIYTTPEFHDAHLRDRLAGERFWLRSLHRPPSFRPGAWTLWQYHNRGRRPGVAGPVDLNAFNGSRAAFDRFAAPRAAHAAPDGL